MSFETIRSKFVKIIYADHNNHPRIQRGLAKVLAILEEGDIGLNIGAGQTRIHPQIKNLDIFPAPHIDIVAKAEKIPLESGSVKVIITQETLEHVQDPNAAVEEMYRILSDDGKIYCQLPFIIGYHPGPTDFWRFTKEGMVELFESHHFICDELSITVGPAVGFYRITVEFWATLFSVFFPFAYKIFKGCFAVLFFPIKWLDPIMMLSKENDRIAGGYYVIVSKK
jgi:SAM-dependent methyltransferase